ncbi:MAG: AMP-binding protein [Gammaproteobacteria bacterium]|nr:AMP-binding protein [Gammaproteobacteria bacterium]
MTDSQQIIESKLLSITRHFLLELDAERAIHAISIDASLERELGIDSLGKVELFHRIETTFSIRLPEKVMAEVDTLRDLMIFIEQNHPTQLASSTFTPTLETSSLDLSSTNTLLEVIQVYARYAPDRPHIYLHHENGQENIIRYGQLFEIATQVAQGIQQHGIKPGETIAIMLPTSDAFFYAFCGTLLAGAIPVPIYPPFRPDKIEEYIKREAKILENAQVRLLITFSQAEMLSQILRTFIPSLKAVTTIDHLKTHSFDLKDVIVQTQDIALIQYTSGSTGEPKGVTLTHANILANIRAVVRAIPIKPTDAVVSWLPLYHDMGLMNWMGSLYAGIPVTIMSPLTFLSRPEEWLWKIHYHRATLSGGPNFAYELCIKKIDPKNIAGLDLSSWRFAFNGAEAIQPSTLERFTQKFAAYGFKAEAFAPVYGLAESTVGLTCQTQQRVPRIDTIQREAFALNNQAIPADTNKDTLQFLACGEAFVDHAIRIVDDAGNILPERMVGNIQFTGPSAMQGYYNNPIATQKIWHDGWWDSGDLGYLADKEIFITGRKKDLIIKAGRNLYPEEIENIVNQIPHIRKGCVVAFGVNDQRIGTEKLIIVAETYERDEKQQHAIRAAIIEKVAIFLDTPPDVVILAPPQTIRKTSSGKLQRSACKQEYLSGKISRQPISAKFQLAKLTAIGLYKKCVRGLVYGAKLFFLMYVASIFMMTFPFALMSIFLFPRRITRGVFQFWARNFFRLVFCPVLIKGKDFLHANSPMIFVSNHASYADSLLMLGILPTNVLFVGKKEILKSFIMRKIVNKFGFLTVDRIDFNKNISDTRLIEAALQQKNSVFIFPEGTFTYATGLRPFKLGAFSLAVETQTPICPIAIQGMRSILRGDTWLPKPGKIKITIAKPIYPEDKEWREVTRLHTLVRTEIAKHCGEAVLNLVVAGAMVNKI